MEAGKTFARKHAAKLLTLLAFLGIWQLVVMLFGIKEFILPSPVTTFAYLLVPEHASNYRWLAHISTTLSEILISFAFTACVGIAVAIIMTWSRLLRKLISPIIILFNSLPKIALAPLFLLWFGYGLLPNVLIAFMIAFFPIVINSFTGLNAVDEDLLDLVRYLHASKWQIFVKIQLPNSLPYIFSGFKISATLCVVGAIVGEFIASTQGLGFLLKSSQGAMDTPPMFASLILISIMGLSFFGSITLLERWLMPWEEQA
ncbi:ABC transporter permease subunit [candidate division KSB3 bacterium]|uniref:ABC transporter permease subunit n=1 Tax=candidate division KSB3 bacterium TaxID=2044937 RepID=A0A9D5Q4Z4_9BACT|nr:ABC transporter permease subunit [candidate division KSB3 bacterium]MBD3324254.1 ABC transporter permease subunit [candidate division KSB3 bacterium]